VLAKVRQLVPSLMAPWSLPTLRCPFRPAV